jgi:hypothetical protein
LAAGDHPLKNRGLQDIFIACIDGLKGFPEAIEPIYLQTQVQLCMVHMMGTLALVCLAQGSQADGNRFKNDLSGGDVNRS